MTVHGNRGTHAHIVEHYFCYAYDDEMRAREARSRSIPSRWAGDRGCRSGGSTIPSCSCTLTDRGALGGQGWMWMNGNGVFWDGAD